MKPGSNRKKTYVVQEFGTSISLNVVTVEVSPTKLDIDPILVAGSTVGDVLDIGNKRRPGDNPL